MKTIAFLYPGAMGASLAMTLHKRQPNLKLLTSLPGRSQATTERAAAAGLGNVSMTDLVQRSDVIFSILPPSAAVQLAEDVIVELSQRGADQPPLVYIDANAISPETTTRIATKLRPHGVKFIDACVIGGPAREGYDPKVYLSAGAEDEDVLAEVARVISGGADGQGLKVEVMHGAGAEAASALKMCYGGINKGSAGLGALMVLAANAHSPGTANALMKELSLSAPGRLEGLTKAFPDMVPKAYRWVGEMEEIASFIRSTLGTRGSEEAKQVAATYEGIAQVFQRLADDLKLAEDDVPAGVAASGETRTQEIGGMLDWASRGAAMLQDDRLRK